MEDALNTILERAKSLRPYEEYVFSGNTPQICWNFISMYQTLSEPFIEKFANAEKTRGFQVDWNSISQYQKLSAKFIEKYKNRINIKRLILNDKIKKNYKLSKILHIDMSIIDEIWDIKKFKDINIIFNYTK